MIGQVELIVGQEVQVEQQTWPGKISMVDSMTGEIIQTSPSEDREFLATARIVAFIDANDKVSIYDPTVEYMDHAVRPASPENLIPISSNNAIRTLELFRTATTLFPNLLLVEGMRCADDGLR